MHHGILVKVRGNNKTGAQDQADMIIEGTLRCDICEASKYDINWDCFNWVGDVNEAWIEMHRSELKWVNTIEDLVLHYINLRLKEQTSLRTKTRAELRLYKARVANGDYTTTMLDYYIKRLRQLEYVIKYGDKDESIYAALFR